MTNPSLVLQTNQEYASLFLMQQTLNTQINNKNELYGEEDWTWQMMGPRRKIPAKRSRTQERRQKSSRVGTVKSSPLCWNAASPWMARCSPPTDRLLIQYSLCINQIFILQNQHLHNRYNKCISTLTSPIRTTCYDHKRRKQLPARQAEGQQMLLISEQMIFPRSS